MKSNGWPAGLVAALSAASAIAQPAPPAAARVCLEFGEIYNGRALDSRTLIVEDNLHRKFRVSLLAYCPNLTFKERVGFRSPAAMRLSCLSQGDSVIVNNLGAGLQRRPSNPSKPIYPSRRRATPRPAARSDGIKTNCRT